MPIGAPIGAPIIVGAVIIGAALGIIGWGAIIIVGAVIIGAGVGIIMGWGAIIVGIIMGCGMGGIKTHLLSTKAHPGESASPGSGTGAQPANL